MADEVLLSWGDRLKGSVEENALVRWRTFGQPPHTDAEPGERLDALLEVYCSIVAEDHPDPVGQRALIFRHAIIMQAQSIATAFENALLSLEQEAFRLIHANVLPSLRYIVTGEFAPGCLGDLKHNEQILSVASLNGLPPNHPYRTLIPEKDLPRWNDTPNFVLGPARANAFGQPKPRGWYAVSQVKYFSSLICDEQREQERKRREARELTDRLQQKAAAADPRWQMERMRDRIAELEREVAARRAPPVAVEEPADV